MKEDKAKHQTVPELMASGEPKTSSSMLTLPQLNKEAAKKEAAAEAVKVRCRVCFKEIAPTPRCFGHGGGGGGDGGSSGASENKAATSTIGSQSLTQSEKITATEEWQAVFNSMSDTDLESILDEKSFDPEIIAELIAEGLLLIDNDRESITLSIILQCEPNLLTKEQRHELKKFMVAILKEFNEFKKENQLSENCMKIIQDEKGNILSLRITMPTLALYDTFIQRLANNLTPSPSRSRKIQEEDEVTKDHNLAPNPFSMEPKPSSSHEQVEEDKKEQEIFNPSPFKMKPLG